MRTNTLALFAAPLALLCAACATPGTALPSEAKSLRLAGENQYAAAGHARDMLGRISSDELHRLADQGDRVAAFALGYAYENGFKVQPDLEEALTMYTLAAEPVLVEKSYHQVPVGDLSYASAVSVPTKVVVVAAAPQSVERVKSRLNSR
ncbi:MAG: SEL1-like repeat protein [Pseudomonadota bacterium]